MSTELYYFSGTGNSQYVAGGLQERLPEAGVLPMVKLLAEDAVTTRGNAVGFVFPVHALTIPIAVKRFVAKTDLRSTEYIFAVATRGGTVFRGFPLLERLLKRKGRRLDAHFILNMPLNDPREERFRSPNATEVAQLTSTLQARLDSIGAVIGARKTCREPDSDFLVDLPHNLSGVLTERLALLGMTVAEYVGGVNYFYSDDQCTGCGVCAKVCLSGKIRMVDEKPLWQKSILCYMCYACVNFCPRQAVQIKSIPGVKSHTPHNGRYTHPYATAKDIAAQKASYSG